MEQEFWDLSGCTDTIALIDEDGIEVSFGILEKEVDEFIEKLPDYKALIFAKTSNSKASLITYLACLKAKHPLLLLDNKLSFDLFNNLISTYQPNVVCIEGKIKQYHDNKLSLNPNLALLLSTSGSTGSPKLVRLSADNIQANAKSIAEYLEITENERAITTLPMSYSYGLSIINSHFYKKASVVLSEDSIISRELWNKITQFNVSTFAGVPFLYQMLKKLKYKRFDTSTLRYITQAGGKLDTDSIKYFNEECSLQKQNFIVMYGQTEATARMSYVPFEYLNDKVGSIGIAIPNGKLSVVDDNGESIQSPHVEGVIHYEGPNVMLGYAESLKDLSLGDEKKGKLNTGDLGYFDDDGFFYITGRLKRFIKMFGLRLSLDAIEAWLISKNYSVVVTGKDDFLIVCAKDAVDVISLKKLLSSEYKININNIDVKLSVDIPRTTNGKVDYKLLLEIIGD